MNEYMRFTTIRKLKAEKVAMIANLAILTKKDPSVLSKGIDLKSLTEVKRLSKKKREEIKEAYSGALLNELSICLVWVIRVILLVFLTSMMATFADQIIKVIEPQFSVVNKDFYAAAIQLLPMLIIALYISDRVRRISYLDMIPFMKTKFPIILIAIAGTLSSVSALAFENAGFFQLIFTMTSICIVIFALLRATFPNILLRELEET